MVGEGEILKVWKKIYRRREKKKRKRQTVPMKGRKEKKRRKRTEKLSRMFLPL